MEKVLYYLKAIVLSFTLTILIIMFIVLTLFPFEEIEKYILEIGRSLSVCGILNLIVIVAEDLLKMKHED